MAIGHEIGKPKSYRAQPSTKNFTVQIKLIIITSNDCCFLKNEHKDKPNFRSSNSEHGDTILTGDDF